jgi:hypothetical protein
MRRVRNSLWLLVPLALAAALLLRHRGGRADLLDQTRERIGRLQAQGEQQRAASERSVAEYAPAAQARLDDLAAPAEALLRQLPGVADVEALVAAARRRGPARPGEPAHPGRRTAS